MRQSIVSLGSSFAGFQPLPPSLFIFLFLLSSFLFSLSATYYLLSEDSLFFLERNAKSLLSSPMAYLEDGNGEDFFIPTGVERVAIPRGEPPWSCKSNKSLEERQRLREGKRGGGLKRLGWGSVRLSSSNANRPPCV